MPRTGFVASCRKIGLCSILRQNIAVFVGDERASFLQQKGQIMKFSNKATTLLAATCIASAGQGMASPNVLLIVADDMGIDASACYDLGNQQASMPNIEALCEAGLVFENAYSAPTCSPTRATMMSGQYGFRTGVGAPVAPDGSDELSVDTYTIFDALTSAGYASNLIGKWHITGRPKRI